MKKILIVEDEAPLAKVLNIQFQNAKLDVTMAKDGIDALEKLKLNKPDLILLDLWLPKMNGFSFLEKIKQTDAYKKIPVIIFSNLSEKSDITRGLALGAEEYIEKLSITLEDLVKRVQHHLK
ncbi:MAG: response regulator [Patescibacteria group bacterium]